MAMYIGTGKYLKETFSSEKVKELHDATHYIIEAIGL
jgi:hypothetical protein